MVIQLDPKRIATPASGSARGQARQQRTKDRDDVYTPPSRAQVNYIPENETLATLIYSAVAALRQGVYWDRGTIVNILV